MSKTAEECCTLIAGSQPTKDVFGILCPIIDDGHFPAVLAAIKMMHTVSAPKMPYLLLSSSSSPFGFSRYGSPQRVIGLHRTLSSASSSSTPAYRLPLPASRLPHIFPDIFALFVATLSEYSEMQFFLQMIIGNAFNSLEAFVVTQLSKLLGRIDGITKKNLLLYQQSYRC